MERMAERVMVKRVTTERVEAKMMVMAERVALAMMTAERMTAKGVAADEM
jgi:hypothetical protein